MFQRRIRLSKKKAKLIPDFPIGSQIEKSKNYHMIENKFWKFHGRVAKWSALRSGTRGDSSSIPAKVKTFFGAFKSLQQQIANYFELILNFRLN